MLSQNIAGGQKLNSPVAIADESELGLAVHSASLVLAIIAGLDMLATKIVPIGPTHMHWQQSVAQIIDDLYAGPLDQIASTRRRSLLAASTGLLKIFD